MDIYWIKDKKKCGPSTVPDVISMVQSGELSAETLGWHSGCSGWVPLRELPALSDFLNPREDEEEVAPEPEEDETPATADAADSLSEESQELPPVPPRRKEPAEDDEDAAVQSVTMTLSDFRFPGAGVRLLARLVDMSLYAALMFIMFYLTGTEFSLNLLPYGPMFWLGLIGMEAVALHFTGTTPGKRLLGIHLFSGAPAGEQTLSLTPGVGFAQALWRSFMVFIGGMGMMAYFLPFIMGPLSLFLLKRRGVTTWDVRARTLPVQLKQPSFFRYLLAAAIIYASLNIVSTCMLPWYPDIFRLVEQQNPEHAHMLREMMPPGVLPEASVPAAPAAPDAAESPGIRFLEL